MGRSLWMNTRQAVAELGCAPIKFVPYTNNHCRVHKLNSVRARWHAVSAFDRVQRSSPLFQVSLRIDGALSIRIGMNRAWQQPDKGATAQTTSRLTPFTTVYAQLLVG
jgi:hypothetical protein